MSSVTKRIKEIKIAVIVLMMVTLVFSLIVSQNEYHLDNCHDDHCFLCNIIHIAQNLISLSIVVIIAVVIGVLIYLFLSRLHNDCVIFELDSLVFQKVQLNE